MDNLKAPVFLHQSEFVQPVEFKASDLSSASKILLYLQRTPGRTLREIAQDLAIVENTVRTCLFRLAVEGEVRKMPRIDGERRCRWEVGEDAEYLTRDKPGTQFKHTTVTEWEPHMVRDPLTAALFGPAKRQDEQE